MNEIGNTSRGSVVWGVLSIVCSLLALSAFWIWGSYFQLPSEAPEWRTAKLVFSAARLGFSAAGAICLLLSWRSAEPRWLVVSALLLNALPMAIIAVMIWLAVGRW